MELLVSNDCGSFIEKNKYKGVQLYAVLYVMRAVVTVDSVTEGCSRFMQ
jgi:hypothetical protein